MISYKYATKLIMDRMKDGVLYCERCNKPIKYKIMGDLININGICHHIKERRATQRTPQNIMVLCHSCHKKVHKELSKECEQKNIEDKINNEIEKLARENKCLKNRCYALSRGDFCPQCPYECENRKAKFIM